VRSLVLIALLLAVAALFLYLQDPFARTATLVPIKASSTAVPSWSLASDAPRSSSDFPDAGLTPGVASVIDADVVCRTGYAASVRPRGSIWNHLKDQAYNRYGIPRGHRSTVDEHGVHHPAYEVDHLIPLELGGDPTDIRNLWPETIATAEEKNEVENELHTLVCSGRMPLSQAQKAIVHNWKVAVPGRAVP